MFEWAESSNELEFRKTISSNGWLKKFLMSYCFDDGFIFFNERRVMSKMGIEQLKQGQYFKQQLIGHINKTRDEIVGTPLHLQSFQYLIYIIDKLRKDVRNHYKIIVPYLVTLDKKDVPYVIDVFRKKFKLSEMQINVLKGGI